MTVQDALKELAVAVKRIVNDRIRRYGYNERARKNTLEGSELQESLNVHATEDGIALQIADYWEYVSLGWHHSGRFPNTFSEFVENVNNWVTKKNIHIGNLTQNEITYYVIKQIWEKGIKARPFMIWDNDGDLSKMIPELNNYMDKWFDDLFEAITEDLNKYFNG